MNNTYNDNLKSNETRFMMEKLRRICLFEDAFPELQEVAHTPAKVSEGIPCSLGDQWSTQRCFTGTL